VHQSSSVVQRKPVEREGGGRTGPTTTLGTVTPRVLTARGEGDRRQRCCLAVLCVLAAAGTRCAGEEAGRMKSAEHRARSSSGPLRVRGAFFAPRNADALLMSESMKVVSAKPHRPSGAGLANRRW